MSADPEAGFRLKMCTFMKREQKRWINGGSTLTSQFDLEIIVK